MGLRQEFVPPVQQAGRIGTSFADRSASARRVSTIDLPATQPLATAAAAIEAEHYSIRGSTTRNAEDSKKPLCLRSANALLRHRERMVSCWLELRKSNNRRGPHQLPSKQYANSALLSPPQSDCFHDMPGVVPTSKRHLLVSRRLVVPSLRTPLVQPK